MKTMRKFFIFSGLLLSISFLSLSFVEMNANPAEWSVAIRWFLVSIWSVPTSIALIIVMEYV